jgi:predicted nucleotide-binding protein
MKTFCTSWKTLQRVFVVHGESVALRESVARMIERLGLEPIILQEQADRGNTIIEKFIEHADVAFAVILLTGDDQGGSKALMCENYQLRARQNVIFELGYFVAKLGRDRVCALYEEGVEVPSDYSGVLYIKADAAGAWQLQLAGEFAASGLSVDLNRLKRR